MAKSTSSDIENEDIQSYQYKIILLGDGAVGKTSIATRFSEEKFSQNYKQTVGVDFFMKRISVPRKDS
jgi:Ras-related protein Rab-28